MYYTELLPMMRTFEICPQNCSGRGDCLGGKCLCEISYDGGACKDINLRYAVPFGAVFYIVCITSIIQLVLCIREDFRIHGKKSILRPTTPKLLYFLVTVATASRGLYFSLKDHISEPWSNNLFVCYYPVLLSLFSLIICYWAEVFHLDLSGKPKFLTKSVIGFATFNILVYSLLFVQLMSTKMTSKSEKMHLQEIFTACFALMMLLVLLFFLIYGVEIFCKLHGAFLPKANQRQVNISQLTQSRLGLIVQAGFQLVIILSLLGDVVGKLWKHRMSQWDRNVLELTFRIFELGIAVWFPCVLWNAYKPEKLWILNPRLILRLRTRNGESSKLLGKPVKSYSSLHVEAEVPEDPDCLFCQDPSRLEAGPLIRPCSCNAKVHHECIKMHLLKRDTKSLHGPLKCIVCLTEYQVVEEYPNILYGFGPRAGAQTAALLLWIVASPIGAWIIWLKLEKDVARLLMVGGVVLLEWFLIKLLAVNVNSAKAKSRIKSLRILDIDEHHRTKSTASTAQTVDVSSLDETLSFHENLIETL